MKVTGTALALAGAIGVTQAAALHKRSSNSWAGANNYFLQSLTTDQQQSYLSDLASNGAKVVRVWVNAQPGDSCEKAIKTTNYANDLETTIGQYNDDTLALLDTTISLIQAAGMRALVSPHDANNVVPNRMGDAYGQAYPTTFYTDSNAASAYDARLSHIANYVSPSAGVAWKDWDAIVAWDIQNEPFQSQPGFTGDGSCGDSAGWFCNRVVNFRVAIGGENAQKITSGGLGGDYSHGCNFADFAVQCPSLDIVSIHRYANNGWDPSGYIDSSNGKLAILEEWGIPYYDSSGNNDQPDNLPSSFQSLNSGGFPWLYWEILPPANCGNPPDSTDDSFAVYQGGNIDYGSALSAAANTPAAQDWTGIIY